MAASLEVLERCRVSPSPALTDQKSLPLTFFDLVWVRLPPVQFLSFFHYPQSKSLLMESVVHNLKHSLSLTLHHFYPLAGNLTWPPESGKPVICYVEGDSVELTIAESSSDFHHLCGNHAREMEGFHPLVPHLFQSDTLVSAMSLQITLFPNHGFCIGITLHHAVADGKTRITFMNAWASLCRSGARDQSLLPHEFIPFLDRTVIKDPSLLEAIFLDRFVLKFSDSSKIDKTLTMLDYLDLKAPSNIVLSTFTLSRDDLKRLKKWVMTQFEKKNGKPGEAHLSTFVITYAYVSHCIVKADEQSKKAHLPFVMDCRARLDPPIPETYFGNCLGACFTPLISFGDDGVAVAADALSGALKEMESGVLRGAEDWPQKYAQIVGTQRYFSVAGSTRFRIYGIDFGWGSPTKVETTSIGRNGAISLVESRNGDGGVEIGLALKKQHMDVFASLFISGLKVL